MPRKKVEVNPECGLRLKWLLRERGIKQIELAKKLNYEPQHVSSIITGKKRLTPETAYQIADMFRVRAEWLLCQDDYRTQEEKEVASQKAWEEGQRVSAFYDKIFRCFIGGLEDMRGYGLHAGGSDLLTGEYVTVTNAIGDPVGAIPAESFQRLRMEVEDYASYLVQRVIKTEMGPVPQSGREGIEKWQTFKNTVTNPGN